MSPLEPSNPATAGPEYSSTAETQEKDLKIAFMNTIEFLKGEMDKALKGIQEIQILMKGNE